MDRAEVYDFLRKQRLAVVSSIGPEGAPQSALVGVAVTPALEIIFDTLRNSSKYRNLSARPACSVVLGWSGEQTVQLDGEASTPTGPTLDRLLETYFAVWPECRPHLAWPDIGHL